MSAVRAPIEAIEDRLIDFECLHHAMTSRATTDCCPFRSGRWRESGSYRNRAVRNDDSVSLRCKQRRNIDMAVNIAGPAGPLFRAIDCHGHIVPRSSETRYRKLNLTG